MGDLAVTVRLNGVLVEDRILKVSTVVRLGDAPDATVPFPGADLAVVRIGSRLALRGRCLEEGEEMELSLGATQVLLQHTPKFTSPPMLSARFDRQFMVAALLVLAVGSWIDAASYWVQHQPSDIALPFTRMVNAVKAFQPLPSTQLGAAVRTHPDALLQALDSEPAVEVRRADGPVHVSDDQLSGTAYYAWYRSAILDDAHQSDEAMLQFLDTPGDPEVRRIMARTAYNRDDYDAAAWHYRWLLERDPDNLDAKLRLARSIRRLGFHSEEIEIYREVLQVEPNNVEALSGMSTALLRLGRLDESQSVLDTLMMHAPRHPYTHITQSIIFAWHGRTEEAVAFLEKGFDDRDQLSEEMQVELRRDISLEPAFQSLRRDWHLRAMLLRHLGAAAPRPMY